FKAEHEEVFRRPGRISFVQVYVNPASRGERAMADAERILRELQQDADSKAAERGDRLMVQTRQEKVSEAAVISRFGLP
ncbi:MAG: hypothetical protein GWM87_10065, partial [Xanthomonadales bacterium]|nr:hypothetical protein [Xanthomonadales bacterium]NIX13240.1 hypothetical protein [Xanthomonadales bacterium]